MQYELLRIIVDIVMVNVMLWAPGEPCNDSVTDNLPWVDTEWIPMAYEMEEGCRVSYRANLEEIPDYLKGYDVWRVNRVSRIQSNPDPYETILNINGIVIE